MAITGVADAIQQIRQQISSAKQEGIDAVNSVTTAVATFRESADSVKKVAKELTDEAQQLRDAIGEVSNGGPPLDTPSQS